MAFLGSFGKFVDRTVHNKYVQAAFPVVAVASLLGKGVIHGLSNTANKLLAGHPGQHAETQIVQLPQQTYAPYGQYSVAPSGFSDYGQGGGFAPSSYSLPEPTYNYEVPPWDYSTYSAPPIQTRSMYQASPQIYLQSQSPTSGGVEELLALALPLIL